MSFSEMSVAPTGKNVLNRPSFEAEEELSSGTNGKWFFVPPSVRGVAVTFSSTTGVGKIQTTTSSIENIKNDAATAIDWPNGEITDGTSQDRVESVRAFRLVRASGTVKMEASTN